jgi:hypothetical protein
LTAITSPYLWNDSKHLPFLGCSSSVKKATLLKTLQKSAEGKWDQFGKCLDILLIPFSPHIKGDPSMVVMQKEMAGRLLNLVGKAHT